MSRLSDDRNIQQPNQNPHIGQSSNSAEAVNAIEKTSTLNSGSFIVINSNPNDETIRTAKINVNTNLNSVSHSKPSVASTNSIVGSSLSANVLSDTSQSNPKSYETIAKKRLKLDPNDSCGSPNIVEDLTALKVRILEHKFQRLKGLIEK